MALEMLVCMICGDEKDFERPPCKDGHDEDCPDLVCVECGWAISWTLPHDNSTAASLREAG